MSKLNKIGTRYGQGLRTSVRVLLVAAFAVLLNACYVVAAKNVFDRDGAGAALPWWCAGSTPALTQQQCLSLSWNLDSAMFNAVRKYSTVGDLPLTADEYLSAPSGIGVVYVLDPTLPTTVNAHAPNALLYAGNDPDSRLVGIAWAIDSGVAPTTYTGAGAQWVQDVSGIHWLAAWVVRGHQNHPDVFATSHPCLTSTGSDLMGTGDACFLASHTEPFKVMVTNDDGVLSHGIDAVVEGLYDDPRLTGAVISIVAPAFQQSGSGDQASPLSELSAVAALTLNGRAATAIESTDLTSPRNGSGSPADAVLWGLMQIRVAPELVLSGINEGQNVGILSNISGTVGAARTARRNGVPAIGSSQGGEVNVFTGPYNYIPSGVDETLALVEQWRLGHTVNATNSVLSINIPSCPTGFFHRGVLQTNLGACVSSSSDWLTSSCISAVVVADGGNDVDAFHNGYVGITNVGTTSPVPTCP
jgi:5'-nucleotidase